MKKLWFLLLAVCLIGFLTGCDSGGGGGSSSGGGGGGEGGGTMTYVVTGLLDTTGTSGLTQIEGGIRYTVAPAEVHEDYSTLTIDVDKKTFSLYEKDVVDGAVMADLTYSGTWEQTTSTTITAQCNKKKDTGTGTESPETWNAVFAIDGDTTYWSSGEYFIWIWTKQ